MFVKDRSVAVLNTVMRHFMRIVESLQYEMFPPNSLYHTTSPAAAFEILESKTIRPPNADGFVSLSEKPHLHDISAHGAVLVFDLRRLYAQLEPVEYTEAWAHDHPAEVSYIAGEGWVEQWQAPEPDDDEWEDDDTRDAAYHDAEQEAFFAKSDEHEWISLRPGLAVRFDPQSVTGLILDTVDAETRQDLIALGYGHIKLRTPAG
jgi:hypothetical protein